jgi:nucleotide-binding universal stress UspA family protein
MANELENLMPKLLVVYTDEKGTFAHAVGAALDVASRFGSRVILYDASSASAFSEPIAGAVSAEGVEEQFGNPLSPEELERLGRPVIAEQVLRARKEGTDAWGWLPSEHGIEALWEDARERGADLVVLPEEIAGGGFIDRLRGEWFDDDTLEDAPTTVMVVDRAGNRVLP